MGELPHLINPHTKETGDSTVALRRRRRKGGEGVHWRVNTTTKSPYSCVPAKSMSLEALSLDSAPVSPGAAVGLGGSVSGETEPPDPTPPTGESTTFSVKKPPTDEREESTVQGEGQGGKEGREGGGGCTSEYL